MRLRLAVFFVALALGACGSQVKQFQDGLYNVSGAGAGTAVRDFLPETADLVRNIRQKDTPPRGLWEILLPDESADIIQLLDARRLLVGTLEVDDDLGAPAHGPVQLHDTDTGRVLWQTPRPSYPRGQYAVLSMSPSIVLMGRDAQGAHLFSLDPSSGARRWEHAVKGPFLAAMTPDGERIVLATTVGNRHRVQAIPLATGSPSWTTEVDGGAKSPLALIATADSVLLAERRLTRMTLDGGRQSWSVQHPVLDSADASVLLHEGSIVLWNADGAAAIDAAGGRVRWSVRFDGGGTKLLTSVEGRLLRVGGGRNSDRIQALHPATGAALWTADAGGIVVGSLVSDGRMVFYSTDEAVAALELGSGRLAFRSAIPPSLLGHAFKPRHLPSTERGALPDQLRIRAQALHLSRNEKGIAAYELPDGKLLWEQAVPPGFSGATAIVSALDALAQGRGAKPAPAARSPGLAQAAPNTALTMAQRNYDGARSRYQSVQGSPGATRSERSSARGQYLSASSQLEIQERMAADSARANAGISATMAIGFAASDTIVAAKQARDAKAIELIMMRAEMALSGAYRQWQNCFQDDFYLQPFGAAERGVMLVDLRTGERSDVVFAVLHPLLGSRGVDVQSFAIDWDRKRLYAEGVGLHPERYQGHVKARTRKPRPSLLAYDISQLEFQRVTWRQEELMKAPAAAAPRNYAQLVIHGDRDGIRRAIEAGVNISAPEPGTGVVLLNVATALSNKQMVKFLLDLGADPTVRDGTSGKTAIELARIQPDREVRDMVLKAQR